MELGAGLARGLLDDYSDLITVVRDFQNWAGHAGLDGLDDARSVVGREARNLVDGEARSGQWDLKVDHRNSLLRDEDANMAPGQEVLHGLASTWFGGAFRAPLGLSRSKRLWLFLQRGKDRGRLVGGQLAVRNQLE